METLTQAGELTPPSDLALATGPAPYCLVSVDGQVFENGSTPEGIMHLLGNAFEWTSTPSECADPYRCPTPWDGQRRVTALFWRGLSCMVPVTSDDLASPTLGSYGVSTRRAYSLRPLCWFRLREVSEEAP